MMKISLTILLAGLFVYALAGENTPPADHPKPADADKTRVEQAKPQTPDKPTILSDAQRFLPRQRGGAEGSESLWAWPATQSGHFCYSEGKTPILWRESADLLEYLDIQTSGAPASRLRWLAGENALAWPELPLQDGQVFQLSLAQAAVAVVTVHRLPGELQKSSEKAVWMAQQGCVLQAQKLFEAKDPDSLF